MADLRTALRDHKLPRHFVLGALLFAVLAIATSHSLWTFAPAFGLAVAWELFDVVAGLVTSQVLGMVARVALYEYATDDRRVGPFEGRDPADVFPDSS